MYVTTITGTKRKPLVFFSFGSLGGIERSGTASKYNTQKIKMNITTIKNRSLALAVVIASILIVYHPLAEAQTVLNGGFETPVFPTGDWSYSPTNASWSFITNTSTTFVGYGGIANVATAPWCIPGGYAGNQVAILQNSGTISQSISFPVSGVYRLTYLQAGRCANGSYAGNQQYDVMLDSTVIGADLNTTSSQPFTPVSLAFYSNPGAHTLSFQGIPTGGDNTAFLDQVAISLIATNATLPNIYTAVQICWDSATNHTYQLQWASSLNSTNWTNLTPPVAGTGTNICVFDATRGHAKRFYRVITLE